MAGIGFRLQRILRDESYASLLQGYLYSAIVAAGPWLTAVFGLAALGSLVSLFISHPDRLIFRAIVIYVYMGSLILTGPLVLGTTRYIADRLFVNDTAALTPCFHWLSAIVVLCGAPLSLLFFAASGVPFALSLSATTLFVAVSITWVGMTFLSAAKDYLAIVRAFLLGHLLGVIAALFGAIWFGLDGMLWGYAVGQVSLATILTVRIRIEFPRDIQTSSAVKEQWHAMPSLLWIGLFYNLGIWIDKIVFWYGPHSEQVIGLLRGASMYDTCIFLGYLSIVPAMAQFLIRIETGFYKRYAAYYEAVTRGASLTAIENARASMMEALRLSAIRVLKLQGSVTFVLVLSAPLITPWLGLRPESVPMLRLAFITCFLQVLVLLLMIVILYFDLRRDVAKLSILFFSSNALLTLMTQPLDARYHGSGYLCACLLTLIVGLICLEKRLKDLEYLTFAREPIRA